MLKVMSDHLDRIDEQFADLDREIATRAREDDAARRLMTISGIGPVTASAILSLAPPIETFAKGRDFSAWLGLTTLRHSTGGKPRLGSISKMGDRTIRRLLIIGGSSIVRQIRAHSMALHYEAGQMAAPDYVSSKFYACIFRGVHRCRSKEMGSCSYAPSI
jgi:transposase